MEQVANNKKQKKTSTTKEQFCTKIPCSYVAFVYNNNKKLHTKYSIIKKKQHKIHKRCLTEMFQNEVKKHEGTTIRNHLRASRLWSAKYIKKI